jgi:hypothetical protein
MNIVPNPHTINPPQNWPDWKPSESRRLIGNPVRFTNGYTWEMDQEGNHRIVTADGKGGDWISYRFIAISPCGQYIAMSHYYACDLPAERLLKIEAIDYVPEELRKQWPLSTVSSGGLYDK